MLGRLRRGERATRVLIVAVVMGILGAHLAAAPSAVAARGGPGLQATYFHDAKLARRALTRVDRRIDFRWGHRSPHRSIAADTFSARWRGYIEVPRAGRYTIYVRASDGARLWIDGKRRLNRWGRTRRSVARESAVRVTLTAGRHQIRLDYYEHTGTATARLLWKGPGMRKQVVPKRRLFQPGTRILPRCGDRLDNDGDGRIDHPSDPDCASRSDPTEGPSTAEPWSDPATWGGTIPADGASVRIPAGKVVTLDRSVSLASLTVNGTLRFARKALDLEADWVVVHGRLEVGTEGRPFTHRAVIRLRDRRPGEDVMGMGDKVVAVMGGQLELHGERRRGWTQLSDTAPRGTRQITLADPGGWRVGDRLAIASTDYAHAQDEEATVTAAHGATLTLDRALDYSHHGAVERIAGGVVDERAEVGLLSRNVTVEGEAESSANGFGAQIMVMNGGEARISGVELHRVGQAGLLRRYPIHFHMLGDAGARSYVRDSSIHHSSNRCATLHGTNRVTLAGNVCFDHVGHGIFLEDGAEQHNIIERNLGFGTHTPAQGKRLLPSDASPATFWITNPDNVVRDNVAAGSAGHGFWIALPQHPVGLFAAMHPQAARAMWPRRTPLVGFDGNTAHSNDQDGLHFDRGPRPDGSVETAHHHARQDPSDTDSPSVVTTIRDFVAYKNRGEGAWLRGSHHRLVGATLADNAVGATFASEESFLQESLVVGETANTGTPASWELDAGGVGRSGRSHPRPWDPTFPVRGFQFYDGRVGVENTTFANFQPYTGPDGSIREQSALGYVLDNDFPIHPRNFARAIRFEHAKPVYLESPEVGHDGDVSSVFLDADGSVTGSAGRSVMASNPFLLGAGCQARTEWNAQVCIGDYATLIVDSGDGNANAVRPVTLTRADGQVQRLMASAGDAATDAKTTVLTGGAYRVDFNGGTPPNTKFVLSNGAGRSVRVSIPHASRFRVLRYGCDVGVAGSWCAGAFPNSSALDAATRSGYWYDDLGDADATTGTLHLRLVAENDWDELEVAPG